MSFSIEVLIAAAGTYLLRVGVIAFAAGRAFPPRVRGVLRLILAAVLPALVANSLVFEDNNFRAFGPWYVAFAVALGVAVRTRSMGWTLSIGMSAVWIATAVWP